MPLTWRLTCALCASIEQQVDNVAIEVEADEIELSIDRAVPLGLVLNEAAANSVKHAFGEDRRKVADNERGIENLRPAARAEADRLACPVDRGRG